MAFIAVISHDGGWGTRCNRAGVCGPSDMIRPGEQVHNVHLERGIALEGVVQKILAAKPPNEKITKLFILAHGDSGVVFLPGQKEDPLKYLFFMTSAKFAPLREHFHPYQRAIELHCCGVASDTSILDAKGTVIPGTFKGDRKGQGYQFMKQLAMHTHCTVQGYINREFNSDRWTGPTVLVYPTRGLVRL